MERKIMIELLKWKADKLHKPLLLYGTSGCGKTYSILEFGKTEYKNIIYFDCFNNLELNYIFEKNTNLEKLIRGLSAISLETIFQGESLIVFDNITLNILKEIKKIFSSNNNYDIVLITNDEGLVTTNKGTDFAIKKMTLVGFDEYLKYIGKDQLVDFIEDSFKSSKSMPFHNMAFEAYNDYVLTGGYPSSILSFTETENFNILGSFHEKSIILMKNKFFSLENLIDIKRSNEIFDNISLQLLKENKKFLYGLVRPGGRAKDYINSIDFMAKNNLIVKCNKINEIKSPLNKIKDEESFKLYFNDSGILYKQMNISSNRLLTNTKLLNIIYENNIMSTLNQNGFNLYYYHSDGKSELDLVIQTRTGKLIPIEFLQNENSTKSKSMSIAMSRYELSYAIRFTYGNFQLRKGIAYVPYYAAFCIRESM